MIARLAAKLQIPQIPLSQSDLQLRSFAPQVTIDYAQSTEKIDCPRSPQICPAACLEEALLPATSDWMDSNTLRDGDSGIRPSTR